MRDSSLTPICLNSTRILKTATRSLTNRLKSILVSALKKNKTLGSSNKKWQPINFISKLFKTTFSLKILAASFSFLQFSFKSISSSGFIFLIIVTTSSGQAFIGVFTLPQSLATSFPYLVGTRTHSPLLNTSCSGAVA